MDLGTVGQLFFWMGIWAFVIGGAGSRIVNASPRTDDLVVDREMVACVTTILRDGSRLHGFPIGSDSLSLQSRSIGDLKIPFVEINSFEMRDRETATLRLRDGGRVNGSVNSRTLDLKTSIGAIKVPFAEIARCNMCAAAVVPGNVALASRGAEVKGVFDGGSGPCLIDGNTTDYDGSKGFAHVVGLDPEWVIALPRVYLLSEIRVLLWEKDNRFQRFVIETSVDGVKYRVVGNRTEGEPRSCQVVRFSPCPVRYIRIRGTYYSRVPKAGGLDVVELEAYCPSQKPRKKEGAISAKAPGEFQVDYAGVRWDLMRTGWKVEDGKLASQRYARPGFHYGHGANGRGALAITGIGDRSWDDYEVAFDFKMLPANREFYHAHIPGDSRGISLVFRAKLLAESWNQPHTCYSFGLRPSGSWSLGVSEDYYMPGHGWSANRKGKTEQLGSGKSESCQDASEGRLRLRVKGNTIAVWLNDEKLIEHTHVGEVVEPIPYGGFGVG